LKKSPNALIYLSNIRINPKLGKVNIKDYGDRNSSRLRCDIEFYLPQIVSHYMRIDLDPIEENQIQIFIIKCCKLNIFFAHKAWFNLKASLINKDNEA
jgi:hypothetical protein